MDFFWEEVPRQGDVRRVYGSVDHADDGYRDGVLEHGRDEPDEEVHARRNH